MTNPFSSKKLVAPTVEQIQAAQAREQAQIAARLKQADRPTEADAALYPDSDLMTAQKKSFLSRLKGSKSNG